MLGHAVYGRGRMEKKWIHGLPVCKIYLRRGGLLAPYLRARQWKALRRQGVRYAVLPMELREEAGRFGVHSFSVAPLRRALLGRLAGRGRCVKLCAEQVDADVEKAAVLLARRYRYVALEIGRGGEYLTELLYLRFGVAQGAAAQPELTVTFREEVPAEHTVCLGERCGEHQRVSYAVKDQAWEDLPEEYLCALFLAEKLKKEDICVKSISSTA